MRRALASWKRKGGLAQSEDKLLQGMALRGYDQSFAQAIVAQIKGFSDYGFPESHAASFALLAYASSWLKCHEPAAFLAALLNSQPMGFYSRSQLVQDARRHGIEVRPVDVCVSGWEASLEAAQGGKPVVRLGLNTIRGLRMESALRIEEARTVARPSSTHDLALRAALDEQDLTLLAGANALASLVGNRREAMWVASGNVPQRGLLRPAAIPEAPMALPAPLPVQEVVADHRTLGLTLGAHPLTFLRQRLHRQRFMPAEVLAHYAHGQLARGCGIVTVRQRPETAKGVVFVTLEDETGNVNVIIWPSLVEQQRREVMGARLLGVYGQWQSANNVNHLVAIRLVDLTHLLGELETQSRDFH